MEDDPEQNALAGINILQTQSIYPELLQPMEMDLLRNCSEFNSVHIQPSQQTGQLEAATHQSEAINPDGSAEWMRRAVAESKPEHRTWQQGENDKDDELQEQLQEQQPDANHLQAATPPEGGGGVESQQHDHQLEFFEFLNLIDDQEEVADQEEEFQALELPKSPQDPGFVVEAANQLVLALPSDIKPRATRHPNMIREPHTWTNLCAQNLPHKHVQGILIAHAYNIFKVPDLIAAHSNGVNCNQKIYVCPCSKFKIRVRRVNDPGTGQQWRIDPNYMQQKEGVLTARGSFTSFMWKKEVPHHMGDCVCSLSRIPLKSSLVANIPIIQKWIEEDLHPLKKATTFSQMIKNAAHHDICFKFENSQSQWSLIKQAVEDSVYSKSAEMYNQLPSFLNALTDANPNVSAALQNDSEGRFCRLWIGMPIAKQHGVTTQPIYVVDCFHSKSRMYGGVIMAFSSRTGFGRTVVEAAAWLPGESTPHLAWVVQMCRRHGMGFEDAIFTDQGPFLAAINALNVEFLLPFFVMLCLQHIFRNCYSTFGPLFTDNESKDEFTAMMNAASFCEDQPTFFETIFNYLHFKLENCEKGHKHLYILLVLYVFRLQPALWSVFANGPLFKHDDYWKFMKDTVLQYLFSTLYINLNYKEEHRELQVCADLIIAARVRAVEMTDGFLEKYKEAIFRTDWPKPRYFNARTNIAESFAMTALSSGFRYEIPPIAIKMFISVYNKQIKMLRHDLTIMQTNMLTTTGTRIKVAIARQGAMFIPDLTTFPTGQYYDSIVNFTPGSPGDVDNANRSSDSRGEAEHRKSDDSLTDSVPAKSPGLSPSSPFASECHQSDSKLDYIPPQDECMDDDCDFSENEEHERMEFTDKDDRDNDDDSTSSLTKRVKVKGCFTSLGGVAYTVTLSWLYSSTAFVGDPVFKHSCHNCVHFSGMVEFPCFCILDLARYSFQHDKRWPSDHPLKHDYLPASFYPKCFRSTENYLNLAKDKMLVDLPTQEMISQFPPTPPDTVRPPPQYKGTVESGLRIASIGEPVSKARVAKKTKQKKNTSGKTNTNFGSEYTRMAKVNPPNTELATFLLGDDEHFVPSTQQSLKIESTTNIRSTREYRCSYCKSCVHTSLTCPLKAAAGAGVVKPKNISVTSEYVVYTLRDNPSGYPDEIKPTEIAALSANHINDRTFRPYNPDKNKDSKLSKQTKLYVDTIGTKMDWKAMKEHYKRKNKDVGTSEHVFKYDITEKNSMYGHLMTSTHENIGHYTTEEPDIDGWEFADALHCSNVESHLVDNFKPASCSKNTPQLMYLGCPSSLSPTESCLLKKLDRISDNGFAEINKILEQNAVDSKDQLSRLLIDKLIETEGFWKASQYVSEQTAIRSSQPRLSQPLIDTPPSSGTILSSQVTASDMKDVFGIFKMSNRGSIVLEADLLDDSDDSIDNDDYDPNPNCNIVLEADLLDDSDDSNTEPSSIVHFTTNDKKTLDSGTWLNDTVVNLFFGLLQNTVTRQQKVFFLNSYFMSQILDDWNNYDYTKVQTWGEALDLSNANTIYVPINITKEHWILGIIYPQKQLVEICDSFNHKNTKYNEPKRAKVYGHVLLLFMADRAKSRSLPFDQLVWSIVEKECPQQINGNDCGVFVSIYALFHSQKHLAIDYNQKYILSRRPEILESILTRKIVIKMAYEGQCCTLLTGADETYTISELTAFRKVTRCTKVFASKKKKKKKNNNNNNTNSKNEMEEVNLDDPTANKTKKSSSSSCRSSNDEEITHDVVFKAQNLGLYIIAVPTTREIIIAAVSNDHKDECFPGDVLISAEGTGFHASGSAGNPNVKDATKFLMSSKRPLTIRIKRGQPRHREYVAAFHLEQVEYKNSHPKQPPIVTNEKEEKKVASPKRKDITCHLKAAALLLEQVEFKNSHLKQPPIVTNKKEKKKVATPKRKQLPHSLGSESSNSSTYSFSPPEESDDSHDAKKPKKMVDLHADDTIQLMFAGWGSEKSFPYRILSISEEGIDLGISTPITKNAKIAITEHGSKSISTSKLEVYRDFNEYTLHHGSVDGVYLADRNRQRIEKTCATNRVELKKSWAMGDSTTQSQLVESKENENISAPRRLFPESSSTAERVYDRGGGYTDFQSANRHADDDKFHGDNSCKVCHLPYLEFCSIGRYPGVHAKAYSGNRLWSGSVWCCPCFKKKEDMEQEEDDQRKLQEQRQERQAMRRINEAMRARKAKHRKHWQTMRRFMK